MRNGDIESSELFDRVVRLPEGVDCTCKVRANLLMGSPTHEEFGSDPEVLKHFPSTNDVAAAGNLAMALAVNGVSVPSALCCDAPPKLPKLKWL